MNSKSSWLKSTPSLCSCEDRNIFWYQFFFSQCQWNLYSLPSSLHSLPFSTEKWLSKPVWFQGGPLAVRLSILTQGQAASKMAAQTYPKWDGNSQHPKLSWTSADQTSTSTFCIHFSLFISDSKNKAFWKEIWRIRKAFLSFSLRPARVFYSIPCAHSAIQVLEQAKD